MGAHGFLREFRAFRGGGGRNIAVQLKNTNFKLAHPKKVGGGNAANGVYTGFPALRAGCAAGGPHLQKCSAFEVKQVYFVYSD